MPLSVQREPTRLRADDAPTPASLEGLRLPGMGTSGAPWKPPQEDTDTCWPPCPRFWPVPVQKRDAERHRCHLGWEGTPQRCCGLARTLVHRGEPPPTPPA